jgi:hypothetical protein
MCRLKLDQLYDIGLFVRRAWVLSTLLHLFAPQILESDLEEVNCVFVLEFVEKETDKILQLLTL